MCFLVTGTLPRGSDVQQVRRIAGPEGNAWLPITNRHVARQLPESLSYYHVTGSGCDCDSALSKQAHRQSRGLRLPAAARRWTEKKRERWLEQRGGHGGAGRGDLAAWFEYVMRVTAVTRGPVGLLVHWYRGGLEDEVFTLHPAAPISMSAMSVEQFADIREDTLHQYVRDVGPGEGP